MSIPTLLHETILYSADRTPSSPAISARNETDDYDTLAAACQSVAAALRECGLLRQERVAVYLDKRPETVQALFGAAMAGGSSSPSIRC